MNDNRFAWNEDDVTMLDKHGNALSYREILEQQLEMRRNELIGDATDDEDDEDDD